MYTRSFPSRRVNNERPLPPDYGGTALVVNQRQNTDGTRRALISGSEQVQVNESKRPRQPLFEDERDDAPDIPFPPPFGSRGQDERNIQREVSHTEPESESVSLAPKNDSSPLASILDGVNVKSDDLLLLGLALLFFTDKESLSGDIPTDALLILAMLYLSGL